MQLFNRVTALSILLVTMLLVTVGCQSGSKANKVAIDPGMREDVLRVMSYNIHHGVGMDKQYDLERIAKIINESGADLVAIQEVDKLTDRVQGVNIAADLQELTGMYYTFGKSIDFQNGEYGLMILSKWPLYDVKVLRLPTSEGWEPRIALSALVDVKGLGEVRFISTHLQHQSPEQQYSQAEMINEVFGNPDVTPCILAGDFNSGFGSPTFGVLSQAWDVKTQIDMGETYPADKPEIQIDHIMTSGDIKLKSIGVKVLDNAVESDHRPVIVDFQK